MAAILPFLVSVLRTLEHLYGCIPHYRQESFGKLIKALPQRLCRGNLLDAQRLLEERIIFLIGDGFEISLANGQKPDVRFDHIAGQDADTAHRRGLVEFRCQVTAPVQEKSHQGKAGMGCVELVFSSLYEKSLHVKPAWVKFQAGGI
jgi:hypothetical protein